MVSTPMRLAAFMIAVCINSAQGAVTPALAASARGSPAVQQAVDVEVAEYAFRDPPYWLGRFHYGFAVVNNGPETAVNVRFTDVIPEEAVFDSIEIRSSFGEPLDIAYEAPAPGERGTITFVVDEIEAEDWVSAIVYLRPVAEPGTVFVNTATVEVEGGDLDPQNDGYSIPYRVPDPPLIYSVKALEKPGKPFRLRIRGAGFFATDAVPVIVMIGDSPSFWTDYRLKARSELVLTGGKELKRMFPRGVTTRIRVVNGDGGYAETTFTR